LIKAVIFDLQGVVVRTCRDQEYFEYLGKVSGKPPAYFKSEFFIRPWIALECGKITQRQFEEEVGKASGLTKQQMKWVGFYEERIKPNAGVVELAKGLRKNYTIAALSNMDIGRYRATFRLIDPDLFNCRLASCYIGFRKPSSAAYLAVLERTKTEPVETVFIDDDYKNVNAAKELGMPSILFKDAKQLEVQLSKVGVLIKH
jgi:HAD superfamily hydrolase (TIGR01509 family)